MTTIATLILQGTQELSAALTLDSRAARIEAQALLGHALDQPRSWLLAHDTDELSPDQEQHCRELLERRLGGEPVAYILGEREFYGLDFRVTPAVLIPRPETELLVELALARIPQNDAVRVLDLGTGSGAVAVTVAKLRPCAQVVGVDASASALEVAAENGRRLGAANVVLKQGDWFSGLEGESFRLIVSNPPYIAADDPHLRQGDLRFEPSSALASGPDGLDDIRRIVAAAPEHLEAGGWLLFEHGWDQTPRCREMLAASGFTEVGSATDLAGIERVSFGRKPG
ncbi:MAG: peptide chain release factor N(5)-glutamine methyltransferase [Sulfuricellaceae bacterium]|jgi:release factor glutamine methyltransferase